MWLAPTEPVRFAGGSGGPYAATCGPAEVPEALEADMVPHKRCEATTRPSGAILGPPLLESPTVLMPGPSFYTGHRLLQCVDLDGVSSFPPRAPPPPHAAPHAGHWPHRHLHGGERDARHGGAAQLPLEAVSGGEGTGWYGVQEGECRTHWCAGRAFWSKMHGWGAAQHPVAAVRGGEAGRGQTGREAGWRPQSQGDRQEVA